MRAAFTLIELVLVLLIAAILTGLSVPRVVAMRDGLSVQAAVQDVVESISVGRFAAIQKGIYVKVNIDPATATIRVTTATDTILTRDLAQIHGVSITASNRRLTFAPTGIGYGASNTSIVVMRGAVRDTVVMSRVGRVRW